MMPVSRAALKLVVALAELESQQASLDRVSNLSSFGCPLVHWCGAGSIVHANCRGHLLHISPQRKDPQVSLVEGFASDAEAREIIERVDAQESSAWNRSQGGREAPVRGRKSSWCAVPQLDEGETGHDATTADVVRRLVERATLLCGLTPAHAEDAQCVHYVPGGEYQEHHDYYPLRHVLDERGNRLVSIFVYLNEVEEGGETCFPELGPLKVTPKKGTALIWMNIDKRGALDGRTLHAGRPVAKGEKYGLNIWLRQRPRAAAAADPSAGDTDDGDGGVINISEDGETAQERQTLPPWGAAAPPPGATMASVKAQMSAANQERIA